MVNSIGQRASAVKVPMVNLRLMPTAVPEGIARLIRDNIVVDRPRNFGGRVGQKLVDMNEVIEEGLRQRRRL